MSYLQGTDPGGDPQIAVRPKRPLSSLAGSLVSDVPFPGVEEEKAAIDSLRAERAAKIARRDGLAEEIIEFYLKMPVAP